MPTYLLKKESMVGFGSERIYIEKYIENPRHIEVQIIADESKHNSFGRKRVLYTKTASKTY